MDQSTESWRKKDSRPLNEIQTKHGTKPLNRTLAGPDSRPLNRIEEDAGT